VTPSSRGAALVLALVVLLAATAASAVAIQWAVLQLQLGRAWRGAVHADVASRAAAAGVVRGGAAAVRWELTDSLVVVRIGGETAGGDLELLLQRASGSDTTGLLWRLVTPGGVLPLP